MDLLSGHWHGAAADPEIPESRPDLAGKIAGIFPSRLGRDRENIRDFALIPGARFGREIGKSGNPDSDLAGSENSRDLRPINPQWVS